MARLIFQLGDGKTVDFNLTAAVVTLGRSTSNDIVINNGWISSHHAKFERSGGAIAVTSLGTLHGIPLKEYKRVGGVYTVIDLDSHNGVTVNGARISTKELKSGDLLAFGQLEARFEDAATPPNEPADSTAADPATTAAAATPVPPDIPLFVTPSRPRPITQPLVKPTAPPPVAPPPLPPSPPLLPSTPLPEPPPAPEPPAAVPPTAILPAPASPAAPPPTAEPPPPSPHPPAAEAAEVAPRAPAAPAAATAHPGVEPALPLIARSAPAAPPPPPVTVDAFAATPKTAKTALASIQRDVALLEKTLGALQEGAAPNADAVQALARGLIQRIDLLEDLMTAGERTMPGLADRLAPLHASLLELLREHSIERYLVNPGQALDVATRKRITIVEAAPEGEGITEIAEVFRPGYHFTRGSGDLPAVILRKAEVRTLRRPLSPVT